MATDPRVHYENFRYCYDNGHHEWLQKARLCFEFFTGKQWTEQDLAALKAAGRPALTLNVIESLMRVARGMQRALRNDVRFTPFQDATQAQAKAQDMLWLHTCQQNSLDFVETEVWMRGMIMARGFYELRVDFDDNLQGQVLIKPRRSQDIVLDPDMDSYDPADWSQIFDQRWISKMDVEHQFGKAVAKELSNYPPSFFCAEDQFMAQNFSGIPYYGYNDDDTKARAHRLLGRQSYVLKRKDVFIDTETGDTSEIPETWSRERIQKVLDTIPGLSTIKRNVKTVRWEVTVDDIVVHDEDSPYKFFNIVGFFPTFLDGVTMGVVESLLDPQRMYNKVTSQELHIVNTTANSGWKVKRGALKNMTIEELEVAGAKTGLVVELDDLTNLEKILPNQVPPAHDRLSDKADTVMRSLMGVSQQARGFAREDVASEAILANQAASDINFADPLSNLHRTKQLLARLAQSCWQAYYTEERVVTINTGSIHKPQAVDVTLNQRTPEGDVVNDITGGKYMTILVPSPARTNMSDGEFKEMLELKKLGVQIPDSVLIELSSASNKSEILQQMQGDSLEQQKRAAEQQEEMHQLELQKAEALIAKEQSAASLNSARAAKAQKDAEVDPDAAYTEVELARMRIDKELAEDRLDLDWSKERNKRAVDDKKIALELTKLSHKERMEDKKPKPTAGMARKG